MSTFSPKLPPVVRTDSLFPGWRWAAVALAFPLAGLLGRLVGGPVDAVVAALVGGALTGAGLGAVQWWAARGALGDVTAWVGASAVGYALGLAGGAAVVGFATDLGSLVVMGLVSGAVLGAAQGLVLDRRHPRGFATAWGVAMPGMLGLGWSASWLIGVGLEDQFTIFGAAGAVVFTVLSGALLARTAAAGR